MKKIVVMIICILTLISYSGCRNASPLTASEELLSHEWRAAHTQGGLQFEGNNMTLRLKNDTGELLLSGQCFTEDDKLTLVTEEDTFEFHYQLQGEKLTLTFAEKSTEFIKLPKKDSAASTTESE